MQLTCYSIHDVKSNVYNIPFFNHNDVQAKRAFGALVNDPNTFISKYPDDFTLVIIGVFDDEIGLTEPVHPPQFLCTARSLVKIDREATAEQISMEQAVSPIPKAVSEDMDAAINPKVAEKLNNKHKLNMPKMQPQSKKGENNADSNSK